MNQARTTFRQGSNGNGRLPATPARVPSAQPANSGIIPAQYDSDPLQFIREPFAFLAGALPSGRCDENYWKVLTTELADVGDAALMKAVRTYIRTNDNAYRMPTVAELLRLSELAQEELDADATAMQTVDREEAQSEYYDGVRADIQRVLKAVPQEDIEEVQRRVTAAYAVSSSLTQAHMFIYTHLLDTMVELPANYSPTLEIAFRFMLTAEEFTAQQTNAPLPADPATELTAEFPGKFRVRYPQNLAHLLDPDRPRARV